MIVKILKCVLLILLSLYNFLFCSCTRDYIKFESLGIDQSHYNSPDPIIYVISEKTSPPSFLTRTLYWEQIINSTDFSKYFIVFVFHGPASSDTAFKVVSIQNNEGEIVIKAMFFRKYQGSVTGDFVSPAEGIIINKSGIHFSGQLKIILKDTTGNERANTNMVFP
jgi:hypothetical protein